MADDPRPSPSFCRALRDFTSTDASSLSFRKNDVVQIVNRLDSGWWDGILGEVRGWFPSNYVAMISNPKSEELRRVSGASLQMHTLHDKTEQVVAKNGMKKRSHSDNDRLRLRLDRLRSSDSISNTLQSVKPLEPKTAEFLEPALMPARQIFDPAQQEARGGGNDTVAESETKQGARLALLDSVASNAVAIPQISPTLPIVTQHPKPRRMKTQYNLHRRWKSDSEDYHLPTEPILPPTGTTDSPPDNISPPLEATLQPTPISVVSPVPSRPTGRLEVLDGISGKLDRLTDELMKTLRSLEGDESCAQLAVLLTDQGCCKRLLAWRGEAAQFLINLLQSHLDHFSPDSRIRGLFVGVLIKLSRLSGLYPECLVRDDIQLIGDDPVAVGRFGDVWKGTASNREIIAVKVLRLYVKSDVEKLLKEISTEAVTWRQLSHPNVLPFYGVFHLNNNRSRVCLVSPWMENGNIIQFLKMNPEVDRIPLIFDIAEGLEYLHDSRPSIIHGDLKGVNILITPDHGACLADFGLASAEDSQAVFSASSGRTTGTSRWQAPELLDPQLEGFECQGRNSLASDVFSFACVCYELYSGNIPFYEIPNDCRVIFSVTKGERPSRPVPELRKIYAGWDLDIWNLIESCWAQQPVMRPSAREIVQRLRARTRACSPTQSMHRQPCSNRDPLYFWHPSSDSEPLQLESHMRFLEDQYKELSLGQTS